MIQVRWDASLHDEYQGLFKTCLVHDDKVHFIDVFGLGSVLVRASVFRALKQPYFKYLDPYLSGDHSFGLASEDMHFCSEIKKAGIRVLCDPSIVSPHLAEVEIVDSGMELLCALK